MFGALLTRLRSNSAISRDGESLLLSRTDFNREIARERIRATRRQIPFCVVSLKLLGHKQFSQRRRTLIRLLHRNVRLTDLKADLGRNQLCILLVDTPESGGRTVVERLRGLCQSRGIEVQFSLRVHQTDDSDGHEPPQMPMGGGKRRREDQPHESAWASHDDDSSDAVYSAESVPHAMATVVVPRSKRRVNDSLMPEARVDQLQDTVRLSSSETQSVHRLDAAVRQKRSDEFCFLKEANPSMGLYRRGLKRSVDLIAASAGLVVASPVLLACAIAIKFTSKGPVFFRQQREGRGGRAFTIYKLRTMIVDAEEQQSELREQSHRDGPAFKIKHDPRVTRVGHFLRKTCLDELPQLINVLKGEMSMVGPRPLPWGESRACDPWHRRRLDIKPGMTCHWQVNKAAAETFDEWMRMDLRYVDRQSTWKDLRLMAQTLFVPLSGRGSE